MAMQKALPFVLLLVASPALADTFGGFSGVDAPYLVNQDKVCQPLEVKAGVAKGAPSCEKATADVIAHLSIKDPIVQRGPKATFAATATGKTLTVTKDGQPVVTWTTLDPIGKVVEVYESQYEDRVAVAYTMRVLGKEVTNIVAFEVVKTTGRTQPTATTPTTTTPDTTTTTPATQAPPTDDPKVKKAIEAAKKASRTKAVAAWQGVLAMAPDHSEAMYRLAMAQATAKQTGDAVATLDKLSKSSRSDAIEWLVEARFEKAFATLRADPKYRAAVGLDRKAATPYERLMGFGGQWEQNGTSCDTAEVHVDFHRDRSFRVKISTVCQGQKSALSWKGTWRLEGDGIILALAPAPGQKASAKDEAPCTFEKEHDEDALHCVLDRDLDFTVLPTRR